MTGNGSTSTGRPLGRPGARVIALRRNAYET